MTDHELQGLAQQAVNMYLTERRNGQPTRMVLASWNAGEGTHRMRQAEQIITARLGPEWLNDPDKKAVAFSVIRLCNAVCPADAVMIATASNMWLATPKAATLSAAEQRALTESYDAAKRGAREGYTEYIDAITCVAQTPERVCMYVHPVAGGREPFAMFNDQEGHGGQLKLFP